MAQPRERKIYLGKVWLNRSIFKLYTNNRRPSFDAVVSFRAKMLLFFTRQDDGKKEAFSNISYDIEKA